MRAPDGDLRLEVEVDIARTAEERRRGLMGVELADHRGLLIVFPVVTEACIHNEGVPVALTTLYLRGETEPRVIAREDFAEGEEGARCHAEVRAVLEVTQAAGASVQVGDRVVLPPT